MLCITFVCCIYNILYITHMYIYILYIVTYAVCTHNVTSNYILSFVFLFSFLHTTYTHFCPEPCRVSSASISSGPSAPGKR